jgi:hypothetical protein
LDVHNVTKITTAVETRAVPGSEEVQTIKVPSSAENEATFCTNAPACPACCLSWTRPHPRIP